MLNAKKKKQKPKVTSIRACLVHVFKQKFSVFLEICAGEKVCGNTCNVV